MLCWQPEDIERAIDHFLPVKLNPMQHGDKWPVERPRANEITSPLLHVVISDWRCL